MSPECCLQSYLQPAFIHRTDNMSLRQPSSATLPSSVRSSFCDHDLLNQFSIYQMYNHVAKFVFRYVSDWLTSCLRGRHHGQWEKRCWYSCQPGACEAQFGYYETSDYIRKNLESESGRWKSSTWLDWIAKGRRKPARGCVRLKTNGFGPGD